MKNDSYYIKGAQIFNLLITIMNSYFLNWYRDLRKPIAVQDKSREKKYQDNYEVRLQNLQKKLANLLVPQLVDLS